MKKFILLVVIVIFLNQGLFSQDTEKSFVERSFTIQTSPVLMFVDFIIFSAVDVRDSVFCMMDLEGQYKISNAVNVSLAFSYFVLHDSYGYSDPSTEFQVMFKPMFIYRPFKTGLKGYYLGFNPTINLQSYTGYEKLITGIGLGFNTGYKWILKNGFTLQLGTGFNRMFYIPRSGSDYLEYFNSDGSFNLPNFAWQIIDFKLGYSF